MAIVIVAFMFLTAGGIATAIIISNVRTNDAINSNNQKWCQTLDLLTSGPISNKRFLDALLTLKSAYHC